MDDEIQNKTDCYSIGDFILRDMDELGESPDFLIGPTCGSWEHCSVNGEFVPA